VKKEVIKNANQRLAKKGFELPLLGFKGVAIKSKDSKIELQENQI